MQSTLQVHIQQTWEHFFLQEIVNDSDVATVFMCHLGADLSEIDFTTKLNQLANQIRPC